MKTRKYSLTTVILTISLLLVLLSGCRQTVRMAPGQEAKSAAPEYTVNKDYDRGPVKFNMKVDKTEITIAEKINLILEVTAQKDYIITFPEMVGQIDQFSIKDSRILPPKVIDRENIRMVQSYVLEPFLSGDYKIPPLTFKYRTGKDKEENARVLETDEVPVKVKSLLPADLEKLELKDIAGPVEPPAPDLTWVFLLAGGVLVFLSGGTLLIIWLIKRRQKMITALYIPAHEIAFRQLRALVALKHIDNGQFKLFYGGISNILRHYVENRFGLQAPERTTEEFLIDLRDSAVLNDTRKNILREFLKHCDLVKFAELVPAETEIQRTFDLCKNFILETQDQTARIEDTGDHNPFLETQDIRAEEAPPVNQQTDNNTENPGEEDIYNDQI